MNKCKICNDDNQDNFYTSNKNKCKGCTKEAVNKYRKDNAEKVKEYDRNRPNSKERNENNKKRYKELMKTPEGRERSRTRSKKWLENNCIKSAAHIISGNAIRDGKLIKQPCEVCGEIKVDGHHDNYEKPLEVRWLCRKHHAEHHKIEREKIRGL